VDHKPRVLFFSTSDSTRSQMAAGFLRKFAGEELAVVSTAAQSPDSDPLAAEVITNTPKSLSLLRSSNPCRYCRRQAKTWFAFHPCARATRATDAQAPTSLQRLVASVDTTARVPIRARCTPMWEGVHTNSVREPDCTKTVPNPKQL
jgi:hypothetical protein